MDQIKILPGVSQLTVVLVCPDIPQNTGNVGRLCLATGSNLVLVRPLGFRLTDPQLARSGMDYWERLSPVILDSLEEFREWSSGRKVHYLTSRGTRNFFSIDYQKDDVFVFGSESEGLPKNLVCEAEKIGKSFYLPMVENVRCLNLASTVAAVVYRSLGKILNW
jgi:tRNA (cytidine/uridine-2'-O-)-methyltransferase